MRIKLKKNSVFLEVRKGTDTESERKTRRKKIWLKKKMMKRR